MTETHRSSPDDHDAMLRDDMMHGLLTAMAQPAIADGSLDPQASEWSPPNTRLRTIRRFPLAASLSAAAMIALLATLVIPLAAPREAAAEFVRAAQLHLVTGVTRVYDIRISRWGGPFGGRFLNGQVEIRPGTPTVTEGFIEVGESGRRVPFGRDASGAWMVGRDGVRGARLIGRALDAVDDEILSAQGVEAMTLDAVLGRLSDGYDLESFGSQTMRTIVAKRRPELRMGPARVEIELGRDGRTVERAVVELDRTPHPTTIELRLRSEPDS